MQWGLLRVSKDDQSLSMNATCCQFNWKLTIPLVRVDSFVRMRLDNLMLVLSKPRFTFSRRNINPIQQILSYVRFRWRSDVPFDVVIQHCLEPVTQNNQKVRFFQSIRIPPCLEKATKLIKNSRMKLTNSSFWVGRVCICYRWWQLIDDKQALAVRFEHLRPWDRQIKLMGIDSLQWLITRLYFIQAPCVQWNRDTSLKIGFISLSSNRPIYSIRRTM